MHNLSTLTRLVGTAALVACLGLLTACGSDDDKGSESETPSSGAPSGQPPGGFDDETIQQVRECLEAAGIEDALPSDMPTDRPTDLPSDFPTDMPSGMPTDFPSDGQGGGPGGGAFNDPEVQDALEACGIELPSPGQ